MKNKNKVLICSFVLMGFVLISGSSCKKKGSTPATAITPAITIKVPVLTTTTISNETATTANSGGSITNDGGAGITAKGVCWSATSTNPTVADSKSTDGTGIADFSSVLSGLNPGTKYYVRAYATNSAGTGYGSVLSFTPKLTFPSTVTDVDGNVYHTVQIGTQVWMVENLNVSKYNTGTNIIPKVKGADLKGLPDDKAAYCDYNDDPQISKTYGKLYNWAAASNPNIAPPGWHVPTWGEISKLVDYINHQIDADGNASFTQVSNALRETGTTHWTVNTGATNSSGFTALPGGCYGQLSSGLSKFNSLNSMAYFWISTDFNPQLNTAPYFGVQRSPFVSIQGIIDPVYPRFVDNLGIKSACSIRCIKNP